MQDSLKSNSFLIKVLALFLALLIVVAIPLQSVSALTIDGVARIVEIGRIIYDIARLGWDGYELYKDIKSETDFYSKEEAMIAGLDRSTATATISVSGYRGITTEAYTTYIFTMWQSLGSQPFLRDVMRLCGVNERVAILGCTSSYLYGYYFNDEGRFTMASFTNPFGSANASYLTMYSLSDLGDPVVFRSSDIYYSKSHAEKNPAFLTSTLYAFDWDNTLFGTSSRTYYYVFTKLYKKQSINTTWDTALGSMSNSFDARVFGETSKCYQLDTYEILNTPVIIQPTGAEPETRPSSLMQAIHNYNVDNSYTDNSTTVNYFLAPKDQTPTADNVVSPAIFDEETWVFTEPVTGAQYQSSGWTYDYTTRTYDIDLEAGTFTLDGTDVTRIVSQYGNELATITYYDASGNALATDEYNYVMMAASECALNGHTYNANTTKEPTCIASGERTYTCSVCGDQYVEEIAKTDHVYADHTLTQEPTCTVGGISSKTCSTCGDQMTEKLDPLGHDFIAKEITETTYELPPGTSCPSCSGTNYTFSRSGVIYTLLCSDCNSEWTAEADVTYGSTTYVCSNCGESKIEGDATEETQETWFTKFIYKFKWLSSIGQIYRQLVADITSDAETAAAIADGTVTLDEVTSGHAELGGGSAGSEGSGRQYTAPELAVSFGDSDHYGVDWDAIKPLNLSWYAPHKETVDGIVSGILWLGYLFLLIKRAPGIINGASMASEERSNFEIKHRL